MAPCFWGLLLVLMLIGPRAVQGAAGEVPACVVVPLIVAVALLRLVLHRPAHASVVGRRHSSRLKLNKIIFTAAIRGSVLLCRMAQPLFVRLLVISMSPHAAHAARDILSDPPSKFEVGMKEASIVSTYIGLTYYLLPLFTEDWKKVFYDCFVPFSLWLDAAHCMCVLIMSLFFIKDINGRFGEILSVFVGLIASFEAIYHYLEMKLLEPNQTDPPHPVQMTRAIGKMHVTSILMVYLVFPTLVLLQLHHRWYIPDHCPWYVAFGACLSLLVAACACEGGQIYYAAAHRIRAGGNWENDQTAVLWVKIAAAACTLLSDGFDTVDKIKLQHYWEKDWCTMFSTLMSAFSTFCAALLLVGRSIGPKRGKKMIDCVANSPEAIQTSFEALREWVKKLPQRVSDACARSLERRVARFG